MEDAVLIDPDFYVPGVKETRNSTDSRISLFGVFDGHGGRCVSRFVVKHFSSQFRAIWKEHSMSSDLSLVLSKTFLELDEFLKKKSNTKELNRLEREGEKHEAELQNMQQDSDDDDDDDDDNNNEEEEEEDGEYVDLETLAEMQHLSEEQKKALFLNFMMQHANNGNNNDDSSFEEEDEGGSDSDGDETAQKEKNKDDDETEYMNHPAFHCGCTAVVAALVMKDGLSTLYVANAGDSRCVLSRNGIAAEMSKDHKPTDPSEHSRIVNAGGFVTSEGRIDGNLNLSRSFGDFNMKQNSKFGPKLQKVTVYPDVRMVPLVRV